VAGNELAIRVPGPVVPIRPSSLPLDTQRGETRYQSELPAR